VHQLDKNKGLCPDIQKNGMPGKFRLPKAAWRRAVAYWRLVKQAVSEYGIDHIDSGTARLYARYEPTVYPGNRKVTDHVFTNSIGTENRSW